MGCYIKSASRRHSKSGDVYAEVPETLSVLHKCMLTPLIPTATVTKGYA